MALRHTIIVIAIILAGFLAILVSKIWGGNPAGIMKAVLYVFVGLMVAAFIRRKYHKP